MFHPGLFLGCDSQLLLDRLCDELAQRNAALGSHRLRPAEEKIRNLEGRLSPTHITIFMGDVFLYRWICFLAAASASERNRDVTPTTRTVKLEQE